MLLSILLMSNTCGMMGFTIKINLFKHKRFKDGWCRYRIIVSSHLTVFRAVLSKSDEGVSISVVDLGEGPGGLGAPLIFRRN